jgi:hypothetical protein
VCQKRAIAGHPDSAHSLSWIRLTTPGHPLIADVRTCHCGKVHVGAKGSYTCGMPGPREMHVGPPADAAANRRSLGLRIRIRDPRTGRQRPLEAG